MKIESIALQNYRLFRELFCTFHPNLTVIVANNGGGKTTILDAIRIAFGTFLRAFPSASGKGIDYADIYSVIKNEELGQKKIQLSASIAAVGELASGTGNVHWFRSLNSKKSGTTIKDARFVENYAVALQTENALDEVRNWPLLAYYGTGRLWNQKNLTVKKQFASGFHSREAGYIDCMEPASSYKLVLDWLRYASQVNFQSKIKFMEAHPNATPKQVIDFQGPFSPMLKAVRDAANIVLEPSGWQNLRFSETYKDAVATHAEFGVMPVGQLSGVELQWGSNSDVRNDMGAVMSESFPLSMKFTSSVTSPSEVVAVEDSLSVDTSDWYEGYYDEE